MCGVGEDFAILFNIVYLTGERDRENEKE